MKTPMGKLARSLVVDVSMSRGGRKTYSHVDGSMSSGGCTLHRNIHEWMFPCSLDVRILTRKKGEVEGEVEGVRALSRRPNIHIHKQRHTHIIYIYIYICIPGCPLPEHKYIYIYIYK